MKRRRMRLFTTLILCLLLAATGCSQQQSRTPAPSASPTNDYLKIDPDRRPVPQKFTLYYKHKETGFLVPVTRTEIKGDTTLEQFVMTQLLMGPQGNESQTVAALIPEATKLVNVTKNGSTVFVSFDSGIGGELSPQSLGGDAFLNQDPAVSELQNRELLLYSIVNTMTELPGIANVKILIENHVATYTELRLESLAQANGAEPNTSMPSFGRSVDHILQPDDVVALLMNEWNAAQPKWEKIYPFLYGFKTDDTALPGIEEMKVQWPETIRIITVTPDSIVTQEMRGDNTALVAVSYVIDRANGQKQPINLEYFHMISQNGVWKLKLPPHLLDEDYGY